MLLAHGADKDSKDKDECAPLHYAVKYNHLETVRKLLAHNANVDARDDQSMTPLHYATSNGHLAVSQELVAHGTDKNAKNKKGQTTFNLSQMRRPSETAAQNVQSHCFNEDAKGEVVTTCCLLAFPFQRSLRALSRRYSRIYPK
jgi:ankyrin repeat protein